MLGIRLFLVDHPWDTRGFGLANCITETSEFRGTKEALAALFAEALNVSSWVMTPWNQTANCRIAEDRSNELDDPVGRHRRRISDLPVHLRDVACIEPVQFAATHHSR